MDVRHLIGKAVGVPRMRGDEPAPRVPVRTPPVFSPRVWGRVRG